MNLGDLLHGKNIDPSRVFVMRHRPFEPELYEVLPLLAADRPDVFNAYQQTQGPKLEKAMKALQGTGFVASFIGHEPGKALFVGLYRIGESRPLTLSQYWEEPAYAEMKKFGMRGFTADDLRSSVLWFDLALTDFYAAWKGKLIVGWPPPERSWWRRAHRNDFPVLAILEDSALVAAMRKWNEMSLSWEALSVLPLRWKAALEQWRAIYYIFDASDGKGYVGSAYGAENLLGRWLNYAASGHGGNRLLRERNPRNFRFHILQLLAPDLDAGDVVRLEGTWKARLHTRAPVGLNDN